MLHNIYWIFLYFRIYLHRELESFSVTCRIHEYQEAYENMPYILILWHMKRMMADRLLGKHSFISQKDNNFLTLLTRTDDITSWKEMKKTTYCKYKSVVWKWERMCYKHIYGVQYWNWSEDWPHWNWSVMRNCLKVKWLLKWKMKSFSEGEKLRKNKFKEKYRK